MDYNRSLKSSENNAIIAKYSSSLNSDFVKYFPVQKNPLPQITVSSSAKSRLVFLDPDSPRRKIF